ncbi:MAG: quinol:cytochrome c oxidoreductase quinone-binding subunit 2, partial [Rhizobacter sp.]|nr:quinol:cytochrome c oxidoreductase quinone-binding subunit 2 [Rhizobacter sp.]
RMVLYAALWWWLARGTSAVMSRGRAAASLIVHTVFTSLAAVDLLASLVPAWLSSAFGLLSLISQLLAGSAFVVALTAWLRPRRIPAPDKSAPPVWRDLGNLLLMGVSLWGYLSFMQFLIIWAENLPREISWYVPRLQTGWHVVGVVLVLANLVLPLCALLMRSLKDRPHRLKWLALGLLAAQALDAVWMVLPSVDANSAQGWWLCPLLFVGLGWVMFGGLPAVVHDAVDDHEGSPNATDVARTSA